MEIWSEIRREVLTGVLSKRAAIAKYGIGWHTLKKMLAHDEPPGYRQANQRPKPKLEPSLLGQPGHGRLKRQGRLAEGGQRRWFREPAVALAKPAIHEILQVGHPRSIWKKRLFPLFFQYETVFRGVGPAGQAVLW